MNTVITPKALERSKFKTCKLSELKNTDCDEVFLFIFPSNSMVNQSNGDGDLLEVHDYSVNFDWIATSRGNHPATPDTIVHYR